jgi:hypothetical protein
MLIGVMSCFVKPKSSKSRGRDGSDERGGGSIARAAAAPLASLGSTAREQQLYPGSLGIPKATRLQHAGAKRLKSLGAHLPANPRTAVRFRFRPPAVRGLAMLGHEDLALVGALCYKARPLPPAAAEGL